MSESSSKNLLVEPGLSLPLILVPLAAILHYTHAWPVPAFIASGPATVPLAGRMGKATGGLVEQPGAGIGGPLNATFGNAAETVMALQGLRAGLTKAVKASITGSLAHASLVAVDGGSNPLGGALRPAACVIFAVAFFLPAGVAAY